MRRFAPLLIDSFSFTSIHHTICSIPNEIKDIHQDICTAVPKPVKRQNRKSVCLDTGTSQEENENSRFNAKKPVILSSASPGAKLTSTGGETSSSTSGQSSPESTSSSRLLPGFMGKHVLQMKNAKQMTMTSKSISSSSLSFASSISTTPTTSSKTSLKRPNHAFAANHVSATANFASTKATVNGAPNGLTKSNPSNGVISNAKNSSHGFSFSSGRDSPVSKKLFLAESRIVSSTNKTTDNDCIVIKDVGQSAAAKDRNNNKFVKSNASSVLTATSLVECPLCFEFMDSVLIMNHAALCQGKTGGQNTESKRDIIDADTRIGKGFGACGENVKSGNRSAGTNNNSTQLAPNSNNNEMTNNDNDNTQQCPICHAQIDKYKIGVHVVICDGVSATMSDEEDDDGLPSAFGDGSKSGRSQMNSVTGGKGATAARSSISSTAPKKNPQAADVATSKSGRSQMNSVTGGKGATAARSSISSTAPKKNPQAADVATCPVCSVTVDTGAIEVHVNMCLDRLS